MIPAVLVMVLLTLFMLAGVLPAEGNQTMIFRTPVFIGAAGVLAILSLVCSYKRRLKIRNAGFLLTHLGIVILLAGALAGRLRGESRDFILPVHPGRFFRELPVRNGPPLVLPFGIACNRFTVDYYDPSYDLLRPVEQDGKISYRTMSTHALSAQNRLNLGPLGQLEKSDLIHSVSQAWHNRITLTNGWVLQRRSAMPRNFSADLAFQEEGKEIREQTLAVNRPVVIGGWRLYLMSYDHQRLSHVVLKGRRDPGRTAAVTGIWMVMIGTLLLGAQGWNGKGERHESR
jgi:cytochrome c biogenesis protein ResB